MLIKNFGVTLSQLTIEDIELVRYWRNSKDISRFMEYRKFITEEEQKKWFVGLDPLRDFYFLINRNGIKTGLIHTSAVDWNLKTAHAGLFIWDKNYLGTPVPVMASLAMLQCFFENLGMEKYFAKVARNNNAAINYNTALGFRLHEKSKEGGFNFYILEKDDYRKSSAKLKKLANIFSDENPQMKIESAVLEIAGKNRLKKYST